MPDAPQVISNRWQELHAHTPARIGLGRAGISLPTTVNLQFQRDHARARDAVHTPLDVPLLQQQFAQAGMATRALHSAAADRRTYLQRPDLGRVLPEAHWHALRESAATGTDIAVLVADGLSVLAVTRHALPLLSALLPLLQPAYRMAPVCIAAQGRVALGDDVGEALNAKLVIVLIGERPGLSAADSLGLYLTWQPHRGRVDAERNCISNIHPAGQGYASAAQTCAYLVNAAFRAGYSGVNLKDESRTLESDQGGGVPFLAP
jgi:ethanolamine ammonia-lyase small subunit